MKKTFILAVMTAAAILTACGGNTQTATKNFDYKVGTASYTHTNDSYGYTEGKNGRGAVSTTLVAAVFDNDGKIVKISIDEVESKIGFDSTGQLADFTAGEVKSKKELGDAYGMKAASSIGKEWYQQIESLEKWLEGKQINTVIGGATGKMLYEMTDNSYMGDPESDTRTIPRSTSDITKNQSSASMSAGSMAGGVMSDINSTIHDMADGVTSIADGIADGVNNMTGNSWMGEDLKASVTIDTTYIHKAIEKAYQNAK